MIKDGLRHEYEHLHSEAQQFCKRLDAVVHICNLKMGRQRQENPWGMLLGHLYSH